MPSSMTTRSTLLAIVLAVLLLGVTTAFVAFGPEDDGEDDGNSAGGGLPDGFNEIPDDVFVERVFGAQRAEGSWHSEQQKSVNGAPGTSIRLDTESGGRRTHASLEVSRDDGSTVSLQIIAIDGVYYAKGLNSARAWWMADPAQGEVQARAAETFATLLSVQTSTNLADAVTEIALVGPDSVEGLTTAHYRLDLVQPVPVPPGGTTPTATPEGQPEVTLDVWVDEDDRPIRLVTTEVVDGAEVVVTTTYSNYGAEFGITAPPAGQVSTEVPEGEE